VYNMRFPGQYFDQETNTSYNNARDYDSSGGRYAESDPIGILGGPNTYLYVKGNPLALVDMGGLLGRAPGQGPYLPGQGPGASLGNIATNVSGMYMSIPCSTGCNVTLGLVCGTAASAVGYGTFTLGGAAAYAGCRMEVISVCFPICDSGPRPTKPNYPPVTTSCTRSGLPAYWPLPAQPPAYSIPNIQ
jgi:RHS repeat-associated protein